MRGAAGWAACTRAARCPRRRPWPAAAAAAAAAGDADAPPRARPAPARSCVLMCHAPRKEYYKKFLFEPLPGERGGGWGRS